MKTIAEKSPPMTEKVQMVKKMQYEMAKSFSHLQMDTFCHFKFYHNRRNGFWKSAWNSLENNFKDEMDPINKKC